MNKIMQGQVIALFAFDVGYEISLDKLRALMATTPVQPLSRKKQTPTYLQYVKTPQILHLGMVTGHFETQGTIQAMVYDFGAISISYHWSLAQGAGVEMTDLPRISHSLYNLGLEAQAREQVETLIKKIEPAITRPNLERLVEDYYMFIIEKLDEPLKADELLVQNRSILAQTLRFETSALSKSLQDEALSQGISYYDNDLTLIDWNAAIIVDRDYEDTASVLELLNVELLEARYIDWQLDRKIEEFGARVRKPKDIPVPLRNPYKQAIREIADLRLESSLLSERVENALKLVGDQYLARIHSAAARRFYLHEWDRNISRKLDIITDYYELIKDRIQTAQSQTLEVIIVALILVELIVAFVK
ncbi:MAG: hypothetical protein IPJ07_01095 [Acidobacteria bacterium]|nr:hypothetical protein [Acidobacteriota bacterium]